MRRDARDLPVTTDSDAVVAGIDRFTDDFLAARDGAAAILDLAERHPDCALVQLYAAALHVYSQSTAQIARDARPLIARAARRRAELSPREGLLLDLLECWANGEYQRAIVLAETIAAAWPRDIVAVKIGEFLFFQAPDYQRHLRFIAGVAPAHPRSSPYDAMLAFALELAGQYAEAERVAERGIALEYSTPWAHHALGHVYLNQSRLAEGIAAFERFAPSWQSHMRVLQGHNAWHLALLYLYDLQLERALALYRDQVWGVEPESVNEQVDAVALLWRLDLAGQPADECWSAVADAVAPRAGEQVFPFLNAHQVYALARAGRAAEAHAASTALARFAARQAGGYRRIWREIAVPLVEGCRAFAEGAFAQCATLLEPIAGDCYRVGGSDAQNDLFTQTLLVALIESGRRADTSALLEQRLRHRPATPLEQHWKSRVD
jgi:hypothetical protein